ncbi:MAG: hypothetical protein FD148_2104 [Methylocystaceae bacterium]|nr:MAG: hypothetical protein FD148_2104 [Methylocystaceae bacterium]
MFDGCIDRVALFSEHARVMRIGANTLEAVENERTRADRVFAEDRCVFAHRRLGCLREKSGHIVGWRESGGAGETFGRLAGGARGVFVKRLGAIADLRGPLDQFDEFHRVEIDVGKGGEEGEENEAVGVDVGRAKLARAMQILADALADIEQNVLQIGGRRVLAAHALRARAAGARVRPVSLLALVTEHVAPSCLIGI